MKNPKQFLEKLYQRYNRKKYIHPDPLEFLYNYKDIRDREVVGLISSTLAYGNVKQILKSANWVLSKLGSQPSDFLKHETTKSLKFVTRGFKHRFTTDAHLSALLIGIRKNILEYGSLYECFLSGHQKSEPNLLLSLDKFTKKIMGPNQPYGAHLLPNVTKNSTCKRLHMYLRWMVRRDDVDPGGWDHIPKNKLIVPIDTHMHRLSLKFGFMKRKQADLCSALELTQFFSQFSPDDPVKYDFSLTRLGILKISTSYFLNL